VQVQQYDACAWSLHQQTQSCPRAPTHHCVIAFAGATASAGPGGATATAGAGGIAAGVAAAASEAVTHAQNGNCFAAQVALMAAQQQLALTTGENNLTAPKKGRSGTEWQLCRLRSWWRSSSSRRRQVGFGCSRKLGLMTHSRKAEG